MLRGSQAALVPLRTCLLSRLNSPKISCLFSHRNVSVITLFPCFCTFLDAGAAQDVPNLAGCLSCWGKEIAFPCLQLCQSLTPPKLGNKKNPRRGKLCQQVRTIWTLEKAPGCLENGCRQRGDEKNREILGDYDWWGWSQRRDGRWRKCDRRGTTTALGDLSSGTMLGLSALYMLHDHPQT